MQRIDVDTHQWIELVAIVPYNPDRYPNKWAYKKNTSVWVSIEDMRKAIKRHDCAKANNS